MTTKLRITNYWQLTTGNWQLNTSPSAQKNLFMQNKPNLPNAQMNVSTAITMDYVNIRLRSRFKNKANQTQFKANQTQPALSAVEGPVVSMPALSKVEVSNLFQTGHLFYVAKESVFSVVVFLEATCSTKASRRVVRVESSWPSKLKFKIGILSQSTLKRLVWLLTIVDGIQVKGITFTTPPIPW